MNVSLGCSARRTSNVGTEKDAGVSDDHVICAPLVDPTAVPRVGVGAGTAAPVRQIVATVGISK